MLYFKPYKYSSYFCKDVLEELQQYPTHSYIYNKALIHGFLIILGFNETSEIKKELLVHFRRKNKKTKFDLPGE